MTVSRLTLALQSGAVSVPPDGRIAVFDAPAGVNLSALPKDRVQIVQGFAPDHDAWAARGWDVAVAPEGAFAAALVVLPRAKAAAQARLAEALALTGGGPVLVDGAKTDGVDSLLKALRKGGAEVSAPFAKAHGKTFSFGAEPAALAHWLPGEGGLIDRRYRTLPGVFSADGIDRGSALLVGALQAPLKGRVADLGAGWGYVAAEALAAHPGIAEMHLIEADHAALSCARENVTDPRARFHWADATVFKADRGFDTVLTNPPFHVSRTADPGLGRAFLAAAARLLAPHGQALIVANRHLPYERDLAGLFGETREIGAEAGFKLLLARRPSRRPR
ncbi:16S rRNA (guanine1207-N2)-methyltransferase [Rhodovulum sulfidophilum]|uniref:class I SAM-dependent methyltransferase n=1 Tax=Rhodovulum sulfidophilum TaxID=35806 RepID=UPI0005AA5A31|nr:methyltransferase [Rhodovulum sulfidophilum]ANB33648.1 MFS transporter [Rhodovulum sulfidophilum DSM 1374]ANB37469.1 MFS transporter [Rhodovulum sulfidophilum]MCW2303010.1 16S rRNA (guanine1207-N2)-methyltransferase [Rhodovulum sulfidophilum]